MTNSAPGEIPGRGPMMQFTHLKTFPEAGFKEVVRPNFDTLYSLAWVDISKEPAILSVPEIKDRFYMMPILDMWTDVFAVIGTYGTGTGAGEYALCLPDWKGDLPKDVKRIDAPTSMLWILGRTQTNGPKDYDYIHKIQAQYRIKPLSQYGKEYQPPFKKDPTVDDKTPPLNQVEKMDGKTYFNYAMALMKNYPPHITDMVMVSRMQRIGLVPDGFDFDKLPADVQDALNQAARVSHDTMRQYIPRLGYDANGWQMTTKSIGVYGNDYLQRATINLIRLGANPYEQAIYPLNTMDKNGKPPEGGKKYVMHFDKDQLPPVEAFWSITMYDQACLRPRDRFWDIPVPKIDSAFDNLLVPQPSWSPSTTQQLRKLVAAPYLAPNDWTPRSEAYFVFPLAQGTPGKQCGLAATGDYQPSLRSPWLAAEEGFHVENSLNRFAIGDRDELKFDDDGS
ncbi:DUF1254 domain-containing protein, partial [Thiolapillus sp.]